MPPARKCAPRRACRQSGCRLAAGAAAARSAVGADCLSCCAWTFSPWRSCSACRCGWRRSAVGAASFASSRTPRQTPSFGVRRARFEHAVRARRIVDVRGTAVARRDDLQALCRKIFLTPGSCALIWGLAAVDQSCVRTDRAAFACPWRRLAGTRVGSLVGEDGDAPERPLAIGEGLGSPKHRPKERQHAAKLTWPRRSARRSRTIISRVRNGVRCAGVHLIVDLHGAKRPRRHRPDRGDAAPLRRCGAARRCCTSICTTSSRTACPAWRCWPRATSPSTPGRKRAMPRSTCSCAARPIRTPASRCCARPSRPSASR